MKRLRETLQVGAIVLSDLSAAIGFEIRALERIVSRRCRYVGLKRRS